MRKIDSIIAGLIILGKYDADVSVTCAVNEDETAKVSEAKNQYVWDEIITVEIEGNTPIDQEDANKLVSLDWYYDEELEVWCKQWIWRKP